MPAPKQRILTDLEVLGEAAVTGRISVEGIEITTENAQQNYVMQFRDGVIKPRALSLAGVDVPTSIAISWWMGN